MHAGTPILNGVNLKLPPGSRMLLVGGNGAGKTTLLQILAGKHMVPQVCLCPVCAAMLRGNPSDTVPSGWHH